MVSEARELRNAIRKVQWALDDLRQRKGVYARASYPALFERKAYLEMKRNVFKKRLEAINK